MAIRRRETEAPGINLTPMIDVVFLLVIFFMVATKFSEAEGRIDVQVPIEGQLRSLTRQPDGRVVTLVADGNTLLDDVPMSLDQIQQTLRSQVAEYPDLRVALRGQQNLTHGQYMNTLRAIRRSGVTNIGVAEFVR